MKRGWNASCPSCQLCGCGRCCIGFAGRNMGKINLCLGDVIDVVGEDVLRDARGHFRDFSIAHTRQARFGQILVGYETALGGCERCGKPCSSKSVGAFLGPASR